MQRSVHWRSRALAVIPLTLLLVAAACQAGALSPSEVRSLGAAERRWAARSFQDYVFEFRRNCFCPIEATEWARVEVVAGQVTRAVRVDTGAEFPPGQLSWFPTVEDVFTSIRSTSSQDSVKDLVVEFDEQLGFPSLVNVTAKPPIQDGDFAYYLRNAGPLR